MSFDSPFMKIKTRLRCSLQQRCSPMDSYMSRCSLQQHCSPMASYMSRCSLQQHCSPMDSYMSRCSLQQRCSPMTSYMSRCSLIRQIWVHQISFTPSHCIDIDVLRHEVSCLVYTCTVSELLFSAYVL